MPHIWSVAEYLMKNLCATFSCHHDALRIDKKKRGGGYEAKPRVQLLKNVQGL